MHQSVSHSSADTAAVTMPHRRSPRLCGIVNFNILSDFNAKAGVRPAAAWRASPAFGVYSKRVPTPVEQLFAMTLPLTSRICAVVVTVKLLPKRLSSMRFLTSRADL